MNEARGGLRIWTPLLFSIVLIIGMILGFNLRDSLRKKRDITTVIERNDRLEQIIDLIHEKYVDSVNTNVLYEDAMTGILSHLDPHTVYISAEKLEEVNEDLDGSFFGIGVEFSFIRDTIQVTSVIPKGPAERAGVEIGDKLLKVNDSLVAGSATSTERIIRMLRGKQYSKVLVTLLPAFDSNLKKLVIERDAIPIYSVDANLMLDHQTGYIKINRFSATTYDEFVQALKTLKSKGMQSLIIDLRQNPGGYLNAASMMIDEIIGGEKLIVYTKGRRSSRTEYKTGEHGIFEEGKIAVLINEGSASASEIFAGAVQDWDRGVVIGRRSFGKGLVQEQFEMEDGSALRLTIAKYYIPSGRCIQRSYSKGKEAYNEDTYYRFDSTGTEQKERRVLDDTVKYYTANKRVVYGGGGIKPDVYVPFDTGWLHPSLLNVLYSEEFKNMLWDYFIHNKQALRKYRNVAAFQTDFNTEEWLQSLLKQSPSSLKNNIWYVWKRQPMSRVYFNTVAKAQLARFLFHNNGYYAIYNTKDPVVQKALEILHSSTYSKIISR